MNRTCSVEKCTEHPIGLLRKSGQFSAEKSISSWENDPIFGLWQDFMHIFHLSVGIFVILILCLFWARRVGKMAKIANNGKKLHFSLTRKGQKPKSRKFPHSNERYQKPNTGPFGSFSQEEINFSGENWPSYFNCRISYAFRDTTRTIHSSILATAWS